MADVALRAIPVMVIKIGDQCLAAGFQRERPYREGPRR
jgi:hypothetical protein